MSSGGGVEERRSRRRSRIESLDGESAVGTGGGGVVEAKIRVETRRALTCDDQTVGSVAHACTDTRGEKEPITTWLRRLDLWKVTYVC